MRRGEVSGRKSVSKSHQGGQTSQRFVIYFLLFCLSLPIKKIKNFVDNAWHPLRFRFSILRWFGKVALSSLSVYTFFLLFVLHSVNHYLIITNSVAMERFFNGAADMYLRGLCIYIFYELLINHCIIHLSLNIHYNY